MRKPGSVLVGVSLLLVGCVSQPFFPKAGPLQETRLEGQGRDKVLVVNISGLLTSARPANLVDRLLDRPSLPARLKEELTKAQEDEAVKALVLRINSPGGTVTASDILYHEIRSFKQKRNIPVIASIMDLGTSGGYYVALAADRIVAHPSSILGSLGVILVTVNAAGLLEKIGVEATAVTSGPHKDMGSPFRAMTEKDRAIFQGIIDSLHARFLAVVQEGRPGLTESKVRQLADGRIYSAAQAKQVGLIDEIGYLDDAIAFAKQEAGLKEAQVVMYHRPGGYRPNIYAQAGQFSGVEGFLPSPSLSSLQTFLTGGPPQFMYLWLPYAMQ
ncbi:MAG: signal peptide peptidase SppA [Nitrospirae bacterium]|nr:MAG: signal peptide peptidase SppA [Nitrospirota bacterium]